MMLGLVLAWVAIFTGCWLGWQLLRQNGRILLQLDELEKRFNELESGAPNEPEGLAVGSEAPEFDLLDLTGQCHTLAQHRGQSLLLIFFNPECGYCREMMPKLKEKVESEKQKAEMEIGGQSKRPLVLIVSTGDAEKNRQFFTEHKAGCPVLLQNDGEVAKAYQANGTPSGYLIGSDGKIASSLAMGAEALLKLASQPAPLTPALSPSEGEREISGNGEHGRADRFRQRSLARSKLKRDGLKAGTAAPDFQLPRLDGRGELALEELRGRRVLLVFSDPHCGPCNTLAPELEKFHRKNSQSRSSELSPDFSHDPLTPSLSPSDGERVADRPGEGIFPAITVVMISRGEPKENRAKVKEHGLTFPVVLQQQWEISRRYAMFSTPVAYLIDEAGIIAADVAVGVETILTLLNHADQKTAETEQMVR